MFQTQSYDVGIVDQVSRHSGLPDHLLQYGVVARSFGKQDQGGRGQHIAQIFECQLLRNRRVVHARVSYNSEKFVNTRPRYCPDRIPFGQANKNLASSFVMLARSDLGINEDIRVDRLHVSTPFHQVEELIPIQNVNPRLLVSLPSF